jgi:hypothetical protein
MSFEQVRVEWIDARSVYDAIPIKLAAERCLLVTRYTLGFLVHKDRQRLVIAGTLDPESSVDNYRAEAEGCDFTIIPVGWVTKIVNLGALQLDEVAGEAGDGGGAA